MKQQLTDRELFKLAEKIYADHYGPSWIDHFVARCGVSRRTFFRWQAGARLPGPVRAMILAHEKCTRYGVEF